MLMTQLFLVQVLDLKKKCIILVILVLVSKVSAVQILF